VVSTVDDEAADTFENMGDIWYNILMEAAGKIVDLLHGPTEEDKT
jgi:hypothetical protein